MEDLIDKIVQVDTLVPSITQLNLQSGFGNGCNLNNKKVPRKSASLAKSERKS